MALRGMVTIREGLGNWVAGWLILDKPSVQLFVAEDCSGSRDCARHLFEVELLLLIHTYVFYDRIFFIFDVIAKRDH